MSTQTVASRRPAVRVGLAAGAVLAGLCAAPGSAAPADAYTQDSHFCGPLSDPAVNPDAAAWNSTCFGGFPAAHAFDGSPSTFWASDARPCTVASPHWVQAVFAKPRTKVRTITLVGAGSDKHPFDVLEDVTITAGPGDTATTVIATITGNRKPSVTVRLARPTTVKSLRVSATKCFYNWAYGVPATAPESGTLRETYAGLPAGDTTRAALYEVVLG